MVAAEIDFFYKGRKHYGTITRVSTLERITYRIDIYTYRSFLICQLDDGSWICTDPTVDKEYVRVIGKMLEGEADG